ncbi:Large with a UBR1-like ring finger related treble clef [Cryptosporidium sp. chipmunk genotype I]|uniref:Large with a UBR1-like ring finger related treble clef n=1 Tax=Cryptosporidium sp. chipmunk genotype I TaxID=1280935 RepID=UPI00351A4A51|nr:Large with a UBR1-like ring finger related treble clef [Cryptosporidium sp. chipmunk genotype I]
MKIPVIHTDDSQVINYDSIDFIKIPKLSVRESIVKQWFSINKACYSSLQALRFRLLCLRAHLIKCGPELPKNIYNGSTFNLSLSYDEYVSLFIDNKENESQSELLGEIMFLICELVDGKCNPTTDWATLLAIELFSTAYSLDDEKVYWYVAVCETNKNIEYKLPKSSTQKWVKQAKAMKLDSEIYSTGTCNSLNPTNETLDFVIISILELLMNPEFDDFNSIFKNYELDSAFFSRLRLPKEMGTLNRCSQIWSGQHIAYRCITCGTSTSSCICVDCFQNGNHQNHEYYIYKSDYGGCCDCGDEQAWNKDGFCSKHNIKDTHGTDSNVNPNWKSLRSNLKGLFHGILCHVVCLSRLYCTAPNTKEIYLPFHSKLVSKIVEQNRSDERSEDNFNVLDFYMQDEDLSDDSELNLSPEYFESDEIRVENILDNSIQDNSIENETEQIHEGAEITDHQSNQENPIIFTRLGAPPQGNHVFEDIPILQFRTIRGQNLRDGTIPILLLFKQEKNFQMDSYFFQWFISLCESYQSIFLPLMGEIFGSPIHKLLMFGISDQPNLTDEIKSSNKFACKLLKPLIDDYISKRIHTLTVHKVKDLLRAIHSECQFTSVKESMESQNSINLIISPKNYMPNLENNKDSISEQVDIKIEDLTYLDIFWMKWSRQLSEANDSFIHQALVSKIYKQNDLTDLLLVMMFDSKFKEEIFPDIFMRNYNELVRRQDKVLTRIAVQLFTIDRMLVSMALDNNLIKNIFFTTFQILQNSVIYHKVSHENNINDDSVSRISVPSLSSQSSAVVNRKYTYSMHDSKYLLQCIDLIYFIFLNKCTEMLQEELSHRKISFKEARYLSKKLYTELWYNGWLSLLRLVQCMNPHKSKVIEPFEDLKWHSSLLLCCDIQSTVDILLQIIFVLTRIPNNSSLTSLSLEDNGQNSTTLCIFSFVLNTIQSLIQWIHITSVNESWNIRYDYVENSSFNLYKDFGRYFITFEYDSSKGGDSYILHNQSILESQASIHIPLNRTSLQLIYIYLDYISRTTGYIDSDYIFELVENLGILNDVLKISLLEHPLRAYCFVHQAFNLNDGSWLRNGLSPINEAQFYKKSHWSTMYILPDIFSIRLILNLLRKQESLLFMVFSILSHFNIFNDESSCENTGNYYKKETDIVNNFQSSSNTDGTSTLKDLQEARNPCFNVIHSRKSIDKKVNCAVLLIMDIFTKVTSLDLPNSLSFNKSIYRYLLVQYLIRKNRSRSEIQDGLPISSSSSLYYGNFIQSIKSSNINNIIDEILDSFCEKIPASDNKPILYKIKQPIGWMLYDPLLPIKYFGAEDESNCESIYSYFNGWKDTPIKFSASDKSEISTDDNISKKRRIGESSTLEPNRIYQNGILGRDGVEETLDDPEKKFINDKFTKFPTKLCHIPLSEHFSSAIHFNSSRNMYIKSILLSNILHLALPQLFGVSMCQTLMDDVRIIQHSFILLFNLVNIEVMEYVYKSFKANMKGESQLKISLNRVPLSTETMRRESQVRNHPTESECDLNYEFFSIPFMVSKTNDFTEIGTLNSPACNESGSGDLFNVSVYCLSQDCENDDYQYFAVKPSLCNLIKKELSKEERGDSSKYRSPIELRDLNMTSVCDLLRKSQIETIFELLVAPLALKFESKIRNEQPFCLMDILVEVMYSLRIGDNETHLVKSPNKFKFVSKEVLKIIPMESSFFLEWGLSIANQTSPKIESYFSNYMEELYNERKASLQEKATNLNEINLKEKIQEKQRNILQEYMKRQKNFMNNFKKSILLSDEEIKAYDSQDDIKSDQFCVGGQALDAGENSDFCVFCHEPINVSQSNEKDDNYIATFGYLDLQNSSLDSKRNIQSDATLDGFQPNFGYTSFYLTTCGHLIHYKCIGQYYKLFNNENSSVSNDTNLRSDQETRQIQTEECNFGTKSEIQYLGFPLTYYKNRVGVSVKQISTKENGEKFKNPDFASANKSVHILSSISDDSGSKFPNKVRQYDINQQIYHLTNLTCPYCNTFSNIILPFKYIKSEELMMDISHEEQHNIEACKDDYLMHVLDLLLDLQTKYEVNDIFSGYYEESFNVNNLEIDVEGIPILEQILSIVTLFDNLLPFNIPNVNLSINGIPSINPIGFLTKIMSDNIVIDTISSYGENARGLGPINLSSSRSLMYDIVIDSLNSIISKFPSMAISMIYKLFPILRDENKIDVWNYISLQSPSARFQILISLVILIDTTKTLRRKKIQENDTHCGSFSTITNIKYNESSNSIRDSSRRESESYKTLEQENLRIMYILLMMFVLEVFSIVWTFWNPEWDEDEQISKIKNPIVQTILNLNQNRRTHFNEENDNQKEDQSNENEAMSFFQDLIYGNGFHLYKKLDSSSGDIEYKVQKINNPSESRISVNIFGALPIQINPVNSDILVSEKKNKCEIIYSFKVKDCINKVANESRRELNINKYPSYMLDTDSSYLNTRSKYKKYKQNQENELCYVEEFKLGNIKQLKDIVNLGIITWLKLLIRFQNIYMKEKSKKVENSINNDKRINFNEEDHSLDKQISVLLQFISSRFCMNVSILEIAWRILTEFNTNTDINDNNNISAGLGGRMMNSLLTSILDKNLFISLISKKKAIIPLSCLEVLNIYDNMDNTKRSLFNNNINSFYKSISIEEFEIFKSSFLNLGKKFLNINENGQNIVIYNGFSQSTILPPKMFHSLYNKLLSNPIKHWSRRYCNNINNLLICISCGSILCTEYNCCNETETSTNLSCSILSSYFYCYSRETGKTGDKNVLSYSIPFGSGLNISLRSIPIRDHIARCGKGLSFFLHVSSSIILSFRIDISSTKNETNNNLFNWIEMDKQFLYGARACEFSTLYVDEYGEEDKHLVRGKPMVLCPYRWIKLQNIIQRINVRRNTHLNWRSFQPFEFQSINA